MPDQTFFTALQEVVQRFVKRANEELEERIGLWPTNFSQNDVHEVVGALLARQVTLATQLATSPGIWNGHVAPLILRSMADVYITLTWVLRSPTERSRKFIHYGLGQEKLQLEHRKAELETRKPKEGEQEYVKAIEDWINEQRATFLTDVNLGSWSGISTRGMADEAGCIDFYNYVYSPFSACVHSMWHHVAKYNLRQCENPLHQFHSVPDVKSDLPLDPSYLDLAAKYLQKTFATFDEIIGTKISGQSAFELLRSEWIKLEQSEAEDKQDQTAQN